MNDLNGLCTHQKRKRKTGTGVAKRKARLIPAKRKNRPKPSGSDFPLTLSGVKAEERRVRVALEKAERELDKVEAAGGKASPEPGAEILRLTRRAGACLNATASLLEEKLKTQ